MMVGSSNTGEAQKAPRRPHNAGKPKTFGSVGELARAIGSEPRKVTLRGKQVVISQDERLFRITVDSAINGSVADLKLVIQIMIDHPQIASSARERLVLFLAGHDADL